MIRSVRLAAVVLPLLLAGPAAAQETTLRVMSFNVWGAGMNDGKPIDATVAAIRAAGADIVGLQETRLESDPCEPESCPPVGDSVAPALAAALGWHVHDQAAESPALWANAVISRFPVTGASANDLGVSLDVGGRTVRLFNIHLDESHISPTRLSASNTVRPRSPPIRANWPTGPNARARRRSICSLPICKRPRGPRRCS